MQRSTKIKASDMFRVIRGDYSFYVGEIISLKKDDGTNSPFFWKADGSNWYSINFSNLEPLIKSVRNAQVGEVVIGKLGDEYMVLERGQSKITLSHENDFKTADGTYTFDQLERYYTLKAEPEVVDDKTAEAIKVLEEAGYKISK